MTHPEAGPEGTGPVPHEGQWAAPSPTPVLPEPQFPGEEGAQTRLGLLPGIVFALNVAATALALGAFVTLLVAVLLQVLGPGQTGGLILASGSIVGVSGLVFIAGRAVLGASFGLAIRTGLKMVAGVVCGGGLFAIGVALLAIVVMSLLAPVTGIAMNEQSMTVVGGVGGGLGFFVGLIAASLFFVKVVEKRSLASMGFTGQFWPRYGRGLGLGFLFALALMVGAGLLAAIVGVEKGLGADIDLAPGGGLLTDGAFWIALVAVLLAFWVQSASEELFFRGWMLSAVGAQVGLVAAVVTSAVLFGLLHSDRLLIGLAAGLMALCSLTAMGFMFSTFAVRERSVAGVCGFHGGFNSTLVGGGLIALAASSEASSVGGLFADFWADLQDMSGADASEVLPSAATQLVLASLAALYFARPKRAKDT